MPLSSRCLCTSFWCKYLWFKHAVHGHRICSASLNLSLMKLMKDCTPPIYLGVNSTPCTQLLSIYNKNCRAYISAALEPLYGLSNYRTELNRESKIIPIQVRGVREQLLARRDHRWAPKDTVQGKFNGVRIKEKNDKLYSRVSK